MLFVVIWLLAIVLFRKTIVGVVNKMLVRKKSINSIAAGLALLFAPFAFWSVYRFINLSNKSALSTLIAVCLVLVPAFAYMNIKKNLEIKGNLSPDNTLVVEQKVIFDSLHSDILFAGAFSLSLILFTS